MPAVLVEQLTKRFDDLIAVDHLSFSIKEGEVFGLLGPNGAGKTTAISMLATMLRPDAGKALVNGFDISHDQDRVRKSIGIVFQDQSLDEELTAYENMDFHARLYGIAREARKKKIHDMLRLVGLDNRKKDLVKTFSGGMRRRLEIARGLLHEPAVLFLDEPTLGLDPQTRNHIWEHIRTLNREKNITIILTTHYMEEADWLCHTVAIIDRGTIVAIGEPGALKQEMGGDLITIESSDNDTLESVLVSQQWITRTRKHDTGITVTLHNAEKRVAAIVELSQDRGIAVRSLAIHKPTLEDVFLHFTGKTIREEEASATEAMRMRHRMMRRR
ncbi:MAG: ATP-binding cassette domain-containing protein [Chitinispirillaceae bacterium]|nr:ATP-binding cassette domain-containing protein [Chitinispirillaceae bacterium]